MATKRAWIISSVVFCNLWFCLAAIYIRVTPNLWAVTNTKVRWSTDLTAHIDHSLAIAEEGRLADPLRSGESYQPPLFYLLCQLFKPLPPFNPNLKIAFKGMDGVNIGQVTIDGPILTKEEFLDIIRYVMEVHVQRVRVMSALFGAIFLGCTATLLYLLHLQLIRSLVTLAYISTLPSFVQTFTTYNNDSLAAVFGISLLLTLWWTWERPTLIRWCVLAACMTGGAYTKMSISILGVVLCAGLLPLTRYYSFRKVLCVTSAIACGGLSLIFWMVFHNAALTGQLLPTSIVETPELHAKVVDQGVLLPTALSRIEFCITPPGITDGELSDPFIQNDDYSRTKRNLVSHILVTSVFGEQKFEFPKSCRNFVNHCAWISLWVQALILFQAVINFRKLPKFTRAILVVAITAHVVTFCLTGSMYHANFRYHVWAHAGLAAVIARSHRMAFKISVAFGILAHLVLIIGSIYE